MRVIEGGVADKIGASFSSTPHSETWRRKLRAGINMYTSSLPTPLFDLMQQDLKLHEVLNAQDQ